MNTHRRRSAVMRLPFAERMREIRGLIESGIIHRRRKSWWEADHILPVVEGGGECELDNYRTVCIPCHRRHTKELAARRAKARREGRMTLLSA